MVNLNEYCSLCREVLADKKNSHIIPKFLSKDLFTTPNAKHAVEINRDGSTRKLQSTAKLDYLFCNECEHRFEMLETKVSKTFQKLKVFENYPSDFVVKQLGVQTYLELSINPSIFTLFIYSLIFRCSISHHKVNQPFKLPVFVEDQLRKYILTSTLENSISIQNLEGDAQPSYHYCIIKPERKFIEFQGMYVTSQLNENIYMIVVNDFLLFFYLNDSIDEVLRQFSNKNTDMINIAIADDKRWLELNKSIVQKMLTGV